MIGELLHSLETYRSSLRRSRAVNVNDAGSKSEAIELAKKYFSEVRPHIVRQFGETNETLVIDSLWQLLIRLAHGNNSRKSYFVCMSHLKTKLTDASVTLLASSRPQFSAPDNALQISAEEQSILETLEPLVPSAAASYRQGLTDLRGNARLSYRGTATEFRESLRETLDHLAPDDAVTAQAGYKPEEGRTLPTMKQKVRFVLTSRGRNKTQRNRRGEIASTCGGACWRGCQSRL